MSQSLTKTWIHLVFSPKNRQPLIHHSIQKRLYSYINAIAEKNNCYLLTIGGTADHLHLLINLNKNISLSNMVMKIKKDSSKWIKNISHEEAGDYSELYWQRGYGAFSVSQSKIEIVKNYIINQPTHHKKLSFQEELIKLFTQHELEFNEKYLWD